MINQNGSLYGMLNDAFLLKRSVDFVVFFVLIVRFIVAGTLSSFAFLKILLFLFFFFYDKRRVFFLISFGIKWGTLLLVIHNLFS